MSELKLVIERDFSASAETIYDAWLDPNSIKQWMCPGEGVRVPNPIIDARVGGRFEFDMDTGEEVIPHNGEYLKLERATLLQFTWNSRNTGGAYTVVTISIEKTGENSCHLKLTHEGLPTENAIKGHTGGWTSILDTQTRWAKA